MLRDLPTPNDDRLLVGAASGDDAAVWRLDDDRALVFTTDFITPIVDDARTWGRIAATNAVSDVYAMGGRPLLALNLVAWNSDELPFELLAEVMHGSTDVAEAGSFVIGGGHTVDDPIPKFGLAVLGEVHPDHLLTNSGFVPDQTLILTKPLGIGIISTAVKGGHEAVAGSDGDGTGTLLDRAIESMTRLNAEASAAALAAGATGATDVTGFGLLGHLGRAATESRVDVVIDAASVPVIAGVRTLAEAGMVPGGTRRNLAAVSHQVVVDGTGGSAPDPDDVDLLILADAQTSGGLVFGCPADQVDAALDRLRATGHEAAVIGSVLPPGSIRSHDISSIRIRTADDQR